jgi:hypothetical protein
VLLGMFDSTQVLHNACNATSQSTFRKGPPMSITIDHSAITEAKARVISANGRHAVAHKGEADPAIVEKCGSELATAVIARSIVTQLAKRPNLTVPQRAELIDLLLPSDSATAENIIDLLRQTHNDTTTATGGDGVVNDHGAT